MLIMQVLREEAEIPSDVVRYIVMPLIGYTTTNRAPNQPNNDNQPSSSARSISASSAAIKQKDKGEEKRA
jgi:hypothetical protein